MQRLTRIEAEKVQQIIKAASEKLEILAHVPTPLNNNQNDDILNDIESSSNSLALSLEKLRRFEEELSKIETTSALFDSKDISLLRNTHKSVRSVCRHGITDRVAIIDKPISASPEYLELLAGFNELTNQLSIRYNLTVEDEENDRNLTLELADKCRLLEETRRILESKIKEMEFQRGRQLSDFEETNTKLEKELKDLSEVRLVVRGVTYRTCTILYTVYI